MLRTLFLIASTFVVTTRSDAQGTDANPIYLDQVDWTAAARADFYSHNQGSRLITLSWMQALKQRNGQPFLADGLSRYGYLPNPTFEPKRQGAIINFLDNNFFNFDCLRQLENLAKRIGPPKWPWTIDAALAARGKASFERDSAEGRCSGCRGIEEGEQRFPFVKTWRTPVQNVDTDTRVYDILAWRANTGVLKGAYIPFATANDEILNILAISAIGSIAEHLLAGGAPSTNTRVAAAPDPGSSDTPESLGLVRLPPTLQDLQTAFDTVNTSEAIKTARRQGAERASHTLLPPWGSYDALVLQGIWAAAPYLHNGSVPTLAEFLKPSGQRKSQFSVGRKYDIENVGLAATQAPLSDTLSVTDCSNISSGNSRCGHEYGTSLSDQDRMALLGIPQNTVTRLGAQRQLESRTDGALERAASCCGRYRWLHPNYQVMRNEYRKCFRQTPRNTVRNRALAFHREHSCSCNRFFLESDPARTGTRRKFYYLRADPRRCCLWSAARIDVACCF
ncbi:hypothetical protein ACVILK_005293 [Bradyrhizobium embrapense]